MLYLYRRLKGVNEHGTVLSIWSWWSGPAVNSVLQAICRFKLILGVCSTTSSHSVILQTVADYFQNQNIAIKQTKKHLNRKVLKLIIPFCPSSKRCGDSLDSSTKKRFSSVAVCFRGWSPQHVKNMLKILWKLNKVWLLGTVYRILKHPHGWIPIELIGTQMSNDSKDERIWIV